MNISMNISYRLEIIVTQFFANAKDNTVDNDMLMNQMSHSMLRSDLFWHTL